MENIPCAKYLCYIGNHSANSHKSPEAPKIISHVLQVTKPKLRGYMVKNRSGIQTQPKTHCLTTVIHYPGSPGRLGASKQCLQLHKRRQTQTLARARRAPIGKGRG